MRDLCLKEKVMNIRMKDSKIFHVLINRQRQSIRGCIQDLHIDNEVMTGKQNIINGFRKHFSNLAVPIFDSLSTFSQLILTFPSFVSVSILCSQSVSQTIDIG
jgi:hypothetical protein